MSIFNVHINGGGGGGPPSYDHFRFRVTAQTGITNGFLLCCDSAQSGSRDVSWNFDSSLGDGDGYYLLGGNDYMVVSAWHTHPSFSGDTPAANVDIFHGSEHADEDTLGVCDPHIGGPLANDIDATVDFEPCFSDGTRLDD